MRLLKSFCDSFNHQIQIAASKNGKYVAYGSSEALIEIHNLEENSFTTLNSDREERCTCMNFSPDGTNLAIGTSKGTVNFYDSINAVFIKEIHNCDNYIYGVNFSPNNEYLCVTYAQSTITLYCNSGKKILLNENVYFRCVSFSPDGLYLASSSFEGAMFIWCLNTFQCLQKIKHTELFATSMCYSPNGAFLATSYNENNIVVWDTKTWTTVATLTREYCNSPSSFSQDGSFLLSASYHYICLWETKTFQLVKKFKLYESNYIFNIAWCHDKILTGTLNSCKLWSLFDYGETIYCGYILSKCNVSLYVVIGIINFLLANTCRDTFQTEANYLYFRKIKMLTGIKSR